MLSARTVLSPWQVLVLLDVLSYWDFLAAARSSPTSCPAPGLSFSVCVMAVLDYSPLNDKYYGLFRLFFLTLWVSSHADDFDKRCRSRCRVSVTRDHASLAKIGYLQSARVHELRLEAFFPADHAATRFRERFGG
jgi:hypothetical protein